MSKTTETTYDPCYVILLDGEIMQTRDGHILQFTDLETAKKILIEKLETGMNVEIEKFDVVYWPKHFNEEERANLKNAESTFRVARRLYKSYLKRLRKEAQNEQTR